MEPAAEEGEEGTASETAGAGEGGDGQVFRKRTGTELTVGNRTAGKHSTRGSRTTSEARS